LLHHLLGRLDGGRVAALQELGVDEGLEELDGHDLGQAALMEPQLRAHHDHGPAGVVDALAEQVLAEPTLLALEHVGERLERAAVRAGDGLSAATVVEERVDRLLQHPLLVADDDVGSVELDEPLEPVVAVDHPAVEVVEVGGGEAPAVERDEGPEIRRDHRDDLEHHPLGPVPGLLEGLHHLEAAGQLLALGLGGGLLQLRPEPLHLLVDVDHLEEVADGLTAHAGIEGLVAVLLLERPEAILGEDLPLLERRTLRIDDDVRLAVEDALEVLERDVEDGADPARQGLQEPDVRHRRRQRDVAEALAADVGLDHLDAALLADDAAALHPLVLAAVALVVLYRTEDLGAEEPVPLRLEGPVVDRLGLLDLAVAPLPDLLRRGDGDPDRRERERVLRLFEEIEDVLHAVPPLVGAATRTAPRDFFGISRSAQTTDLALRRLRPGLLGRDGLEQFHVEAEGLHLLDEHVERLRQAGLERVVALDDRLVDEVAPEAVVRLDRE